MPAAENATRFERDPVQQRLLLGIDGGGSKTTAVLAEYTADAALIRLGAATGSPTNPRSVGWDRAAENLTAVVGAAFQAAGLEPRPVAALCLAMAGGGHATMRKQLEAWCADQALAGIWCVVHDAQIILRAAEPDGPGIALISGTGSLAYGQTPDGRQARAGGWGYLLGDEGSGYAIGLAALRAVAAATDGRGSPTAITPLVLAQFGVSSAWDLIPAVYENQQPRHAIAALAPLVLATAEQGDTVAQSIRDQAARDLAELVTAVARALDCRAQGYCLSISGGLLVHHAALRQALLQQLAQRHSSPRSTVVVAEPVQGALLLARDMLARSS